MPRPGSVRKWIVVGLFAVGVFAGAGGVLWAERTPLLAWYYVRGLTQSSDKDRGQWADSVAALGDGAEPAVFSALAQSDAAVCNNAGAALDKWTAQWSAEDDRAAALAGRMAKRFGDCSPAGRRVVLDSAAGWMQPPEAKPTVALLNAFAQMVGETAKHPEPEAHAAALQLCSLALDQADDSSELLTAGRVLIQASLRDESPANRLRAVQLAIHPGMNVLEDIAALLKDAAPEVRRAALLAVGPADEKIVPAKSLLPVLHDADPEVCKACEEILRKDRHLSAQAFKIGWCLYHPEPAQRLNVLDYLRRGGDLEPGLWLRELSHDESPAVRLAAVRVMSQQDLVDLSDRLEQMADGDPSPTVSQVARIYQKWAKGVASGVQR
jgi:HEAT repeats